MIEALSLLVRRHACKLLVAVGGALLVGACNEDGGGGDPPIPINSNAFGYGSSLGSIIGSPTLAPGAAQKIVQVTGVRIVHIDTYDENGQGRVGGVFLADASVPPGPNRAVLAFQSVYTPPTFRPTNGDIVDASGALMQFAPIREVPTRTLPELYQPTLSPRFDAVGGPLQAVTIPLLDLTTYETGRPWLSTLVTVENVRILSVERLAPKGFASISLDVGPGLAQDALPSISNDLFDLANSGLSFNEGQTIRRVTGLVSIFSNFRIAPRSATDIEL